MNLQCSPNYLKTPKIADKTSKSVVHKQFSSINPQLLQNFSEHQKVDL